MEAARAAERMSEGDYLAREQTSLVRHEYVDGVVYAMAGGTLRHATLTANVARALGNALSDQPCVVLSSDARVHVARTRIYTYPDVTVLCGPAETASADPHSLTNPTLVVEVLSEGTEAYDRGAKAAHYRRMSSLRGYLLVSADGRELELFERGADGRWVLTEANGDDAVLPISALGVELAVSEVVRGLTLLAPSA